MSIQSETKLQKNQRQLREYVRKHPGKLQKVMMSYLAWSHSKLETTIASMRSEFYSGLVLKSEVKIIEN